MRRVLVLLAAAIVGLSGAIKSLHIYGEPSNAFVEQMKQAASTLIVKCKFSGFNRLPAAVAPEPAS